MNPDFKDYKVQFITIRRRQMTPKTHERIRRAARKMLQDVRKFYKRKGLNK